MVGVRSGVAIAIGLIVAVLLPYGIIYALDWAGKA